MEREKYISLVAQLRQVAVARALALLGDHAAAEDVADEVLLRLWERHDGLHDDPDKVSRLASVMALRLHGLLVYYYPDGQLVVVRADGLNAYQICIPHYSADWFKAKRK